MVEKAILIQSIMSIEYQCLSGRDSTLFPYFPFSLYKVALMSTLTKGEKKEVFFRALGRTPTNTATNQSKARVLGELEISVSYKRAS